MSKGIECGKARSGRRARPNMEGRVFVAGVGDQVDVRVDHPDGLTLRRGLLDQAAGQAWTSFHMGMPLPDLPLARLQGIRAQLDRRVVYPHVGTQIVEARAQPVDAGPAPTSTSTTASPPRCIVTAGRFPELKRRQGHGERRHRQ